MGIRGRINFSTGYFYFFMYFISWNIECDYRVLPFLNDRLKCVLMLQQFCGDLLHMVDNWIDNLIRYV